MVLHLMEVVLGNYLYFKLYLNAYLSVLFILHKSRWCSGEPNNYNRDFGANYQATYPGTLNWTFESCIVIYKTKKCLNDMPCRSNEPDQVYSFAKLGVACQYPLPSVSYTQVDLPQAWNSLDDAFLLHEGEFLLSNNKLYQLNLINGNLFIIFVNIILI